MVMDKTTYKSRFLSPSRSDFFVLGRFFINNQTMIQVRDVGSVGSMQDGCYIKLHAYITE